MTAPSLLRELAWDSRFFNLRIARVERARLSAAELEAIERERVERAVDCGYFLAATDDPESLARVAAAVWRFVDVRATLARDLAAPAPAARSEPLRPAAADDVGALRALAAASHRDSRFYQDGRFPRADCDRLFSEWIAESVAGRLADAVLVA